MTDGVAVGRVACRKKVGNEDKWDMTRMIFWRRILESKGWRKILLLLTGLSGELLSCKKRFGFGRGKERVGKRQEMLLAVSN